MKRSAIIGIVLSFIATFPLAAQPSKPDPLRQLDYFGGKWHCKGTIFASPMGPQHTNETNVNARWGLGGRWMMVDVNEMKSASSPMPLAGTAYLGYDAEAKKYVSNWVDNMGAYATQLSDGWVGSTMTTVGPQHMGPMTMTARDTFAKKGPNEMQHIFEFNDGRTWKKLGDETCHRAK
jgi:hypothetical protein